MCLGAIYWARPKAIYYANTKKDAAKIEFDDQFIYDELDLPLENRNLKMQQMLRDEAIVAFELWQQNINKVEY
jgi:tRNA(Arg) A34 adenosine deaminase TadA